MQEAGGVEGEIRHGCEELGASCEEAWMRGRKASERGLFSLPGRVQKSFRAKGNRTLPGREVGDSFQREGTAWTTTQSREGKGPSRFGEQ